MDKGVRLQKEIAMGKASKSETTRGNVKVQNKKSGGAVCGCGGSVKKSPMKGRK